MDALFATITCPLCGAAVAEAVPTDRCIYFYECSACRAILKPKAGDCCVFCSYGDHRCPSAGDEPVRVGLRRGPDG